MKRMLSTLALTAMMTLPAHAQNIGVNVEGDNTNVSVIVNSPLKAVANFAQDAWTCDVQWWRSDGRYHEISIRYEISYDAGQYREYHNWGAGFEYIRQAGFEYDTRSKIVLQDGTGASNSSYEYIAKHEGKMYYDEGDDHQRGHCSRG